MKKRVAASRRSPATGARARRGPRRRSTLPATQAARRFSDLLNRVEYRGESFIIERGGEPVCEVTPVRPPASTLGDLAGLLASLPPLDDEYRREVGDLLRDQPSLPPSPWDS